jgi:hypothetical protein
MQRDRLRDYLFILCVCWLCGHYIRLQYGVHAHNKPWINKQDLNATQVRFTTQLLQFTCDAIPPQKKNFAPGGQKNRLMFGILKK